MNITDKELKIREVLDAVHVVEQTANGENCRCELCSTYRNVGKWTSMPESHQFIASIPQRTDPVLEEVRRALGI